MADSKSDVAGNPNSVYLDSIKTAIDIPDQALADTMRFTGAKTKGEAVVKAIEDYNRQQRLKQLVSSLGTWNIASNDEIEAGDLMEIETGQKSFLPGVRGKTQREIHFASLEGEMHHESGGSRGWVCS